MPGFIGVDEIVRLQQDLPIGPVHVSGGVVVGDQIHDAGLILRREVKLRQERLKQRGALLLLAARDILQGLMERPCLLRQLHQAAVPVGEQAAVRQGVGGADAVQHGLAAFRRQQLAYFATFA